MPDWLIKHVTQQKEISGAFFIHYNLALRHNFAKKIIPFLNCFTNYVHKNDFDKQVSIFNPFLPISKQVW